MCSLTLQEQRCLTCTCLVTWGKLKGHDCKPGESQPLTQLESSRVSKCAWLFLHPSVQDLDSLHPAFWNNVDMYKWMTFNKMFTHKLQAQCWKWGLASEGDGSRAAAGEGLSSRSGSTQLPVGSRLHAPNQPCRCWHRWPHFTLVTWSKTPPLLSACSLGLNPGAGDFVPHSWCQGTALITRWGRKELIRSPLSRHEQ